MIHAVVVSRARAQAVEDQTRTLLAREVRAAAGDNALVSRTEEAAAPEHVRDASRAVRAEAGPGARVTTAALEAHLAAEVKALVAGVNQPAGVGRAWLSRPELAAIAEKSPALGARVTKAYEIVTGRAADVDGIAEGHVRPSTADDGVFRIFTNEDVALRHRDPRGRSTTWMVKTTEDAGKSTFVWGRDDLWAQRFEVDAKTGALTVTAEH